MKRRVTVGAFGGDERNHCCLSVWQLMLPDSGGFAQCAVAAIASHDKVTYHLVSHSSVIDKCQMCLLVDGGETSHRPVGQALDIRIPHLTLERRQQSGVRHDEGHRLIPVLPFKVKGIAAARLYSG